MQTFTNDNLMTKEYSWKKWELMWIIAFIAGFTLVARDSETARETLIGLGQLHRVISITMLGLIAISFFLRNPTVPFKSILFFWTFFACWQILTVLWSTFPSWTLYRAVEYLIMVLITAYCANYLISLEQWTKWVNLVWIFIGCLLVSVWLGALISPDSAIVATHRPGIVPWYVKGIYPKINPNTISMYAGIICIVAFVRNITVPANKWKIIFLLAFITMLLSQGRSGLGGFAVGLLLAILLLRQYKLIIILSVAIIMAVIFYAFDDVFWEIFRRGQTEEQFLLLSGRKVIWNYAYYSFIINNPLIGFGAYAAGRFLVLEETYGWSSLHSTWVEIAVGNGIPATILFACIVIYCWFVLVKHCVNNYAEKNNHYFIELSAVYSALIFRSIFTTVFFVHSDIVFFLVVGSVFFISKKYRYQ